LVTSPANTCLIKAMSTWRTRLLGLTANATRIWDTGNTASLSYGRSGLLGRSDSIACRSDVEITANSDWPAKSRSSPMSERMLTIFSDWPDMASIIA
jgi:hypothetical protein